MNHLFFLIMIIAYAAGALAAIFGGSGRPGRILAAAGACLGGAAGFTLGLSVILGGNAGTLALAELIPLGGGFLFQLDALGGFFLLLTGIVSVPAAIYGAGYSATYAEKPGMLRLLGAALNLFLLCMSLAAGAGNVLTFLLMWEGMSLASYFLVMTESGEESTRQAGLWYIAMTHVGFAFILAAFLLLAQGGSGSFADLRSAAADLSYARRTTIFLLALIGFGSKAGIVPLHVWLPKAHPAAPSHVSALMSGVMIKMGIYGILRVSLDLLGGGPAWWGALVLGFGVVSALLGVLYALMENDLKRLLAYSSVENVGIILIAVGAGMIFRSYDLPALAAFGLIAALYHTLNHAAFKGLLFLGAGSVLHACGTRNMEKMGGLIKRMPWTAFFFLVGAAAISAIPPLNGFASEWLVFQTLLSGFNIPRPELAVMMPVAMGMLALTSGLAAACFVKAFGISFLALPRSSQAEGAHESGPAMLTGMAILALACLALGLAPTLIVPFLGRVAAGLTGGQIQAASFGSILSLHAPQGFAQISPFLAFLGLLLLFALIPLGLRLLRADRRLRRYETWGCGRTGQTPRMEYTSTAFAEPLRRVFAELLRPTKELNIDFHGESRYFVDAIAYKSGITPLFERWLYDPLLRLMTRISQVVVRIQAGSLHLYLVYLAVLLIVLLLVARWL